MSPFVKVRSVKVELRGQSKLWLTVLSIVVPQCIRASYIVRPALNSPTYELLPRDLQSIDGAPDSWYWHSVSTVTQVPLDVSQPSIGE